jgi:KilA-N domain
VAGKIQKVVREVNGITVEQRSVDGFINATAMCVAHTRDIDRWLVTNATFELFCALASDLDTAFNPADLRDSDVSTLSGAKYAKMFPNLVVSKRGSPENGGGTWLHPDLAVQLAQWCSPAFAIQVSRWIQDWIVNSQNPIASQADLDRIKYRSNLKDEARLRMTDQVKLHLETIEKYDDKRYAGIYFARVHDALNKAIAGETAKEMRKRLSPIIGKPEEKIKEQELIRDYFPAMHLQRYIALCELTANYMINDDLNPLEAVKKASKYALPNNYLPESIDFEEHIKLLKSRIIMEQVEMNLPLFGDE